MKVKQLIAQLKKMPQDLDVYWADHDHGTYETNSIAGKVRLIDKNDMDDFEAGLHKNNKNYECFTHTPEEYVVIRP